ncbi:MAG TPA: hypothetical protein VFE51_09250 [Verrucomicrobiae bacterium]|nr:hypothetical protein [Verrucomicrobiae bacterium]
MKSSNFALHWTGSSRFSLFNGMVAGSCSRPVSSDVAASVYDESFNIRPVPGLRCMGI